jgi:hypothetical protein
MDLLTTGFTNQWIYSSMDFLILFEINKTVQQSIDQWINGSMDQWINGSMDQWINGSLVQKINGSLEQWGKCAKTAGV